MEAKTIRNFLSRLSDHEFRYLRLQISFANDARELVRNFNLTQERFCELMNIDITEYDKYMRGGYNYTVDKMAYLQAAYCTLKAEQNAKQAEAEAKAKFTDI